MDGSTNVWMALAPGLAILGILLLALAVFLIRQPKFEQKASRKTGSVLLPQVLIRYAYWLSESFVAPLDRLGLRPNHVTAFSVVLSTAAAGLIATGHLMSAAWVLFAAMACDLIDGLLARSLDMQSSVGAFFDSFCDRISEGVVFAGLAYYGRENLLFFLSLWGLVASYMISYARGRGEGLGVDCKVGLMQRPERLLVLFFTLLLAPLIAAFGPGGVSQMQVVLTGIGLLAALSTITAGQRALWIMRALSQTDPAAPDNAGRPSGSSSMAEASS
ncbi:CDP-alcohol phosphatidyltransferase family protein [Persicimonas caeni]|nr:CDP-alcohol phosphatidyltransferase family protein [Persicimonas caeni]